MKNVVELILELKNKGIYIENFNEQLKLTGQVSLLTNEEKEKVKLLKPEIKLFLESKNEAIVNSITSVLKNDGYVLSSSQKRLWILSQFDDASSAYNQPGLYSIDGPVDFKALKHSYTKLIGKYEILRTVFKQNEAGELKQYVLPLEEAVFEAAINFNFTNNQAGLNEVLNTEITAPFNLETGPLLRSTFYNVGDQKWVFSFVMHHIISDGWSINLIIKDLLSFYNSFINGVTSDDTTLPIQYKDYAEWQQKELKTKALLKQRTYWMEQLEGKLPVIDLSVEKPRPPVKTFNGLVLSHEINSQNFKDLKKMCSDNGATLFMGLVSLVNVLIYKYTFSEDIIVGTPIAGRNNLQLEDQVGPFINMLPLRSKLTGEHTFENLLKNNKTSIVTAFENQEYPFDELVDDLRLKRDASRHGLFDIMVALQNFANHDANEMLLGKSAIDEYTGLNSKYSRFDISLIFEEKGEGLVLNLEYNVDLFSNPFVKQFLDHFDQLLISALRKPTNKISELDLLSINEKNRILVDFNNTDFSFAGNLTILDLLGNQLKKNPDKTAIKCGSEKITYQQLDVLSNGFANVLIEKGVATGQLIPVCTERSINLIVALLGILKSGAGYVPIDPDLPMARIENMINDLSLPIIVVDKLNCEKFEGKSKAELLNPDDAILKLKDNTCFAPDLKVTSDQVCYMIYTSGSTGKPKGVLIQHSNVVNFMYGMDKILPLNNTDNLLAITSLAFDISVLEIFYTLYKGAILTLKEDRKKTNNFNAYLDSSTKAIDFSLFFFSSQEEKKNNKYDLLMQTVCFADKNKFKSVWLPERHFHEFGGVFPNPAVLGAAVAAKTNTIEIRSGSVVLPINDTIRVAEEWSVVDNLSNGRVGMSIASGWHPDDFVLMPGNFSNRHSVMFEQIDELKLLWKGSHVKRKNGMNNEVEVKIFPSPVQSELPLWITTAGSPETYKNAGKIGAGVLTHLLGQSFEELVKNIEIYKSSLKENGYPENAAKVVLMLHTYIGNDIDIVKEEVKEPFKAYLKSSLSLIKNLAKDLDMDSDSLSDEDVDNLMEIGFERYWQSSALLGTRESCQNLIMKIKSIGVTEVACLIDFGVEDQKVINGLEYLNELKEFNNIAASKANENDALESKITTLQITPTYLKALLEDDESQLFMKSLNNIIVGGEAFSESLLNKIASKTDAGIFNMYGPTETTIWSTAVKLHQNKSISIGKPLANTQIYILDKQMNVCPIGIAGDLYIGGKGLAKGYFNDEELTKRKFIKNPFNEDPNSRIYLTGDLAKWDYNGNIVFIGRNDDQVKVNGYRIELGDVENVIHAYHQVSKAAVTIHKDANGDNILVAFLTKSDNVDKSELKSFITGRLPLYMMPSYFVEIDEIPITNNGKLNRKELADYNVLVNLKNNEFIKPSNDTEVRLVEILGKVLGLPIESIGVNDNFFDLGGNSLKMIKLINEINKAFNAKVSMVNAYSLPNVAAFSKFILNSNSPQKITNYSNVDGLANTMDNAYKLMNSSN